MFWCKGEKNASPIFVSARPIHPFKIDTLSEPTTTKEMGAAASIADAFSAKEIYLLSFKHSRNPSPPLFPHSIHSCKILVVTISELEFLYRQYTTLTTASPPSLQSQTDTHNSVLQHRICTFFFPPKNTPGSSAMMSTGDGGSVGGRTLVDCSFDVFCGKVNDWRKSSVSDRVNGTVLPLSSSIQCV